MLSSDTARIQYTVTTTPQNFAVPFYILASSDIQVIKTVDEVDTTLVLNTDYTVSGAGTNPSTASVNGVTGIVGATLTIVRATSATQPTTYIPNNAFPASTAETNWDRLTMLVQRLVVDVQRCLRIPTTNDAVGLMTKTARKNKMLGFDNNGAVQLMDPLGAASLTGTVIEVSSLSALRAVSVTSFATGRQATVSGHAASRDGGEGLFTYDSSSSATDNDGTIIQPSSGSGRWLRVFSGAVNARWFGAKGDGVTDDTSAIQAALNSYVVTGAQSTAQGGGCVYLPAGIYVCSTLLTIKSFSGLIGDGMGATILDFSDMSSGNGLTASTLGVTGRVQKITLERLKIIGPGRTSSCDGISITTGAPGSVKMREVWFQNWRDAVRMTQIIDCAFYGVRTEENRRGFYIDAPGSVSTSTVFINCYIDQNEQGVVVDRAQTFTFLGNVFENNTRTTVLTEGNAGFVGLGTRNFVFTNGHFESNTCDAYLNNGASSYQPQYVLFDHCMFNTTAGSNALALVTGRQIEVRGCWPNRSSAIYIKIWNAVTGFLVEKTSEDPSNWQYKDEADAITAYPNSGANSAEYRYHLGQLNIRQGGGFRADHASNLGTLVAGLVMNDSSSRILVQVDGRIEWGSGAASRDTTLYRSAANVLKTDDTFEMIEQASAPAAPSSNCVRLYAVDNGAGKTVLYALFSSGAAQQIAIQP